ncbi:MAG: DUF4340 domain-containing protein [Nodosilinea sp.]
MKFQRSTLILVGVAFLLGAGVLVAESQRSQSPETATQSESTEPVLVFEETDVATLAVDRGNETLAFEQSDDGTWQMVEPDKALAEPGAIAFLLSRLNTDSALQTVTMTASQAADFGFNAPVGIVTITLKDGTEHELILGGPDFSGGADYAVVDPDPWPPAEDQDYAVLVVTRDVANGINRPLEEWKLPTDPPEPEASGDTPSTANEPETLEPGVADSIKPEGAASPPEPAAEPASPAPAGDQQPATESSPEDADTAN